MAYPTIITSSFTGRNGTGSISVPGLEVGDILIWLNITNSSPDVAQGQQLNAFAWTELVVSVADEIQQLDVRDHSSDGFQAVFIRKLSFT